MTMKFKSMLGVAMMAAMAFTATSCSDDDNDGNNSEGNTRTEVMVKMPSAHAQTLFLVLKEPMSKSRLLLSAQSRKLI